MKLSKKRAAEIQVALEAAAEAQGAFWDALREVENLADRDINSTIDISCWDIHDLFCLNNLKLSTGREFSGDVIVPDFKAEYDKIIGKRPADRPAETEEDDPCPMPWCPPCGSYHAVPKSLDHHKMLKCRAKYKEPDEEPEDKEPEFCECGRRPNECSAYGVTDETTEHKDL